MVDLYGKRIRGKDGIEYVQGTNSLMPKDFFRLLIAGPSGSGKTFLLFDLLVNNSLVFDKIVLFAKNPHRPVYKALRGVLEECVNKRGSRFESIDELLEEPPEVFPLEEMEGQKNVIFADMIFSDAQQLRLIKEYFIGSRHKRCSCIFLSQSYFEVNKRLRNNCTHYMTFSFPSEVEYRRIAKEIGCDPSKFVEALKKREGKEEWPFVFVSKPRKSAMRNFDEDIC